MSKNNVERVELKLRVIDKSIDISILCAPTITPVGDGIAFLANAHLNKHFIRNVTTYKTFVDSDDPVFYEPPVTENTRFCDLTAEDASITAYVLADLETPSLMARIRALEAEKENQPLESEQGSTNVAKVLISGNVDASKMFLELKEIVDKQAKQLEELNEETKKLKEERKKDKEEADARAKKADERAKKTDERAKKADERAKKADERAKKAEECRMKDAAALKEHEDKIAMLERQGRERKLEQKLIDEATRRYIEDLADGLNATTDFLATGDEATLDRIKRRNLLDRGQKWVAGVLKLSDDTYLASVRFREELGPSFVLDDRSKRLVELLEEKRANVPEAAKLLDGDKSVLTLLAEHLPQIRVEGNAIAHGNAKRSWYEGSVSRAAGADRVALTHLLNFVCGPKV